MLVWIYAFLCLLVTYTNCGVEGEKRMLADPNFAQLFQDVADLKRRVSINEAKLNKVANPIAFKVHLSHSLTPAPNATIAFDDVQLNLGNSYHSHLHGFIAPLDGIYLFSVSVCSDSGHHISVDLVRNDDMIGRVYAGDVDYSDCSSETTITELNVGDEVFVRRHNNAGDLIIARPNLLNSFTGYLLASTVHN